MKFFLSNTFGLLMGLGSSICIASLLYMGKAQSMAPDVATSCFIGLLSIIATGAFMTFLAAAQTLTEKP